ncbi:MAG: hypothetical protein IT347_12630 [Candidatus Eisenbacteria bacterium]|nr:hypothetical protein [Candidatus Eisenbacteria bacterium]
MPPARFVTAASLEFVARRLRFLGFDVVTHPGARLEELFEAAEREGRVVLTTSTRHPRRWSHVAAVTVPGADPAAAVRAIANAHEPAGPPFSRCPRCNQALHRRTSFEAIGEVPGRVTRANALLTWCPACGQWYWTGSHTERLGKWFEAALGRPVTGLST